MSRIPVTPMMAMFVHHSIYSLCCDSVESSIENFERCLTIPVECVMSLEEYINNDFKI